MICDLHADAVPVTKELKQRVDRRLSFALSRFGDRVNRATVHLLDLNGPKGGIDKCCKIVLSLRGKQPVIVEVMDSSWPVAIDRAASRIGHTLSRVLERTRTLMRSPSEFYVEDRS